MMHSIELMMTTSFFLWGASLFFQTKEWNKWIKNIGTTGFLSLGINLVVLGSFIVFFHPVWHGVMAILTILGLLTLLKGAFFLLFPDFFSTFLKSISSYTMTLIRSGGIVLMAITLFLFVMLHCK